jgi:hypothetical protein
MVFLFFLSLVFEPHAADVINVYEYHIEKPYIIDNKSGLTFWVADQLTKASKGKYIFKVVPFPRKRLDQELPKLDSFIVPFTRPEWLKSQARENEFWTQSLFEINNCFVGSPNDSNFTFEEYHLYGKSVAGLQGGMWPQIAHLVNSGKVIRVNTTNYKSALMMLAANRVDYAKVPSIVFEYYKPKFSHLPLMCHVINDKPEERYFYVVGSLELYEFVNSEISELRNEILPTLKKLVSY